MTLTLEAVLSAAATQLPEPPELDAHAREGLTHLLADLNEHARLHERGTQSALGDLVQNLIVRSSVENYLKKHPQLIEKTIEKPLFVFGLPRTGTTLVINLLSVDPMRRCFLRWESQAPVPPPMPHELHSGPRFEKSQEMTNLSLKYAPHISAIHHEDADSPTECQFLMSPTFLAEVYDSKYHLPNYQNWFLREADYLPSFEFHKRYLQLLQAEAPGRWTLKNPWHPLFLNELTRVYPDAQLVMTHRDPAEVLASGCSLLWAVRNMFSDDVSREEIADTLQRTFDVMIERMMTYRERQGWDSIYDVHYSDVMKDPLASIRGIYERFGEPLSEEAESAMVGYMAANPKGKHGKHHYSLEEFGLTREGVWQRYSDYLECFKINVDHT